MGVFLRLAVIALPLLEIVSIIVVADAIGVVATLLLLVVCFLGGLGLIRERGLGALGRVRDAVSRGEPPVRELFETAAIVLAGFLLMVPGFLSDLIALPLLVPAIRRWLLARFGARFGRPPRAAPGVIEGEWHEVGEEKPRLDRPPGWGRRA
jgi:UPF0716 protein FxsA